jgi:mono/diheme cytochrome c family protein
MDELLKKVAEIRGMPASLVERSAQARADKTGATLEEVLTEWAGGDAAGSQPTPEAPASPDPAPESATTANATEDAPSVPGEITVDYLIALAAEAKRMPPKLIQSSAQTRAEHSGEPIEAVLAGWAGVDLDELRAQASAAPAKAAEPEAAPLVAEAEAPAEQPAPAAEAAPVVAAAAGAMTLDALLEKVAEVKGMPASLTKRSAEARAKKTGEPLEAVLLDWAGLDAGTVVAADAAAPAATTPGPEPAPADNSEPVAETPTAEVEVIEGEAPEPLPDDASDEPAAIVSSRYPVWLAAAFVIIPILAVMYILIAPAGPDCGTGGQLLVDPSTGNAVNCDGSAYGTSTVDNFGDGAAVYSQCAACHGADGSGGVGPACTGGEVLATFPSGSCSEHIEWVALGTSGWPDSTYGANAKPVGGGGVMPAFGATLDEVALAQVVLYERVQFGGQDLAEAEEDCGFLAEVESVEAAAG